MTNEEQLESLQRAVGFLDTWREQVTQVTRLRAQGKEARALARDYQRMTDKLVSGVKEILLQLITVRSGGARGGTA